MSSMHSWASVSRSMPPASAFRLPVSKSGTGAFRDRTGSPYSGTGLGPLIPVPEDARIEPRAVATSALAVRSSNHSARSHPQNSATSHPQLG